MERYSVCMRDVTSGMIRVRTRRVAACRRWRDVRPRYHKGKPVFHDGEKYWSCCPQKKCIDFESFMKVPGCVTGKHDDGRN